MSSDKPPDNQENETNGNLSVEDAKDVLEDDIPSPFYDYEECWSIEKPLNLVIGIIVITSTLVIHNYFNIATWGIVLLILLGLIIMIPSLAKIQMPQEYDSYSGFEFWSHGAKHEVEGAREEILFQFPMQLSVVVNSVQKLGTIVGFGFLMITSYGIFVFGDRSNVENIDVLILILFSFILMTAGTTIGINSLVSYKTSPSTGTNLYSLIDYNWLEDEYKISRDNSMAEAFFQSIVNDFKLKVDIRWTFYLLSTALIPMMASAAMCVIRWRNQKQRKNPKPGGKKEIPVNSVT